MVESDPDELLDVAIFGAGVSGVYSAMRMLDADRTPDSPLGQGDLNIVIFEQSSRVGGRLLSLEPPGIPGTRVEVGGMRYTSAHLNVIKLVDYFGLTPIPFPVREAQNFVYVRGVLLRNEDLTDAEKIPYRLTAEEGTKANLELGFTALAADRLIKGMTGENRGLGSVDWQQLSQDYKFEGNSLWDLPFLYLQQRMVSHEAFQFNMDTSGYDSILFTWNGADGFSWNLSDFGTSVTYSRLKEGYQQVPLKCAEIFENLGGRIQMETSLTKFDCVTLPDGTLGVEFVTEQNGVVLTRFARKIILAMPRRSIEMLDASGTVLDPDNKAVRDLIESVTPIPLFKLALCYNSAWWETLPQSTQGHSPMPPITAGESVTDLPVRQLYYWGKDDQTGKAVVLVYDDGSALDYWAGLRSHEARFLGEPGGEGQYGLSDWSNFPAPARMVDEVHRQILEMHGVANDKQIPQPYAASFQDWGDDPYGGGANFWHVGVQSFQVSQDIVQPVADLPVYICGEAYSHQQGWAEGALTTAEDMLGDHLGVLPSAWQKNS